MSMEMITMLVGMASILATTVAVFGWIVHRMDSVANALGTRLDGRLDKVAGEIVGVKSDLAGVKNDLTGVKGDLADVKSDLTAVKNDIIEVKIAIARVEGPPRHLITGR